MKNLFYLLSSIVLCLFLYSCSEKDQLNPNKEPLTTTSKKKIILAIDGGGIKGILPVYFLTQVEAALNNTKSYQLFDVIGGTSTGGIISIGLTTPYHTDDSPRTAAEVLDFYLNDCGSIFYKNSQPTGPLYYADVKDVFGSKRHGVEAFLKSNLGPTVTLKDAAQKLPNKKVQQVFTTSYLINSTGGHIKDPTMGVDFGPYLFNWDTALNDSTEDYYLWEAARATSAAPTYFPVAHLGGGKDGRSSTKEKWGLDGGVMSNDPAVWGITEALRTKVATSMDDLVVISLGCGLNRFNGGLDVVNEAVNHQPFGQKYGFWGTGDWGLYLQNLNGVDTPNSVITETVLYANQFVPATQLESLTKSTKLEYYRVQVDLTEHPDLTPMDSCSNVKALHTFAQQYFAKGEGKALLDAVVSVIKKNL